MHIIIYWKDADAMGRNIYSLPDGGIDKVLGFAASLRNRWGYEILQILTFDAELTKNRAIVEILDLRESDL